MLIRSFKPSDLSSIHAINQDAVPMVGTTTLEELSHIAQESCISLVAHPADAPDQVTAFCMVLGANADYGSLNFKWFKERYDDFIYLDRVAISPAYRRQGLGRALYKAVDELAVSRCPGAKRLTLEVNVEPRNDASLAFHEGMGFETVGTRDTRYGTRVALMERVILL